MSSYHLSRRTLLTGVLGAAATGLAGCASGAAGAELDTAAPINFDARIVAVQTRNKPLYVYATAPGSPIAGLGDLRGRKIGFSQGQAQGLVVLRTLKEQGLSPKDVQLVPLSSTKFLVALQSRQIDIAPLAEPTLTKYVKEYGN